jgi:preflagellin peptidase FlaK
MILRNVFWHRKNKTPLFSGTLQSESIGKKLIVLITGYKMNLAKVKATWHIFPMEDIDEDPQGTKRHLSIVPHEEGRDKMLERLSSAVDQGTIDRFIWATPGLPMLIFVTLGFIVALTVGDIVWLLVRFIIGA